MTTIARRLVVRGIVQGVFYRNWAIGTARDLNLDGWVRNRVDGSVEAVAQGEAEAVARFIALCHEGPVAARVEGVEVTDVEPEALSGFGKRPTA